ncbi:TPA: hypothetical protein ACOBTX_000834 [Enterococcus faecium]
MKLTNLNEIQEWSQNNLINRKQASKISGLNYEGFSSAIKRHHIKPFLEIGDEKGPSLTRLYLKSEVEEYANKLKEKRQKRQ